MSDHLGAAWREYRTWAIPLEAPAVQATVCRRAFYGGATALLEILLRILSPGVEPTPADLRTMDEIAAELADFARAVREERA